MKKDNKGFSLVELIIVIAIMAVLVGILAPQYLKFVARSKVSTDLTNAEAVATAVNASIADGTLTTTTADATLSLDAATVTDWSAVTNDLIAKTSLTRLEVSKVDKTLSAWVVTYNSEGVKSITLGGKDIWPNADTTIWKQN